MQNRSEELERDQKQKNNKSGYGRQVDAEDDDDDEVGGKHHKDNQVQYSEEIDK